jgi:uncharacterized protein (TIGR04255 family)
MERLRDRFKRHYPVLEEQKQINIEVHADKVDTGSSLAGYKLTAANAIDVILIQQQGTVGSIRLAPYESWEEFIARARSNFDAVGKIVGRKEVTRIGTRFMNRCDIPVQQIEGRSITEFVKIGIAVPVEIASAVGPYSLAANFIEKGTGTKIFAQSAIVVPPPLLDFVSISLDIDAFVDSGIPPHKDAIWELAATLRSAKNTVFENSITDELRSLFE